MSSPKLTALHAHNEDEVAAMLAERALREDVALVSDAGTPCVSDPGTRLVSAVLALGGEVRSVPGPSALASALAASGFPAAPSSFLGFPPRKGRDVWVDGALARPDTLVIYEAPGRVAELVARFAMRAPHREAVLARELSKRFEEITRATLPSLSAALAGRDLRGECVLLIGPGEPVVTKPVEVSDDEGLKAIAAHLASRWGCTKREAYQRLLAMERSV